MNTIVLNVVTASNIQSDIRLKCLMMLIDNLKLLAKENNIYINHYISIYIEVDYDIVKNITRDNLTCNYIPIIYHRNEKYSQFDHLNSIFKQHPFELSDIIMFMDDDDLILELPIENLKRIIEDELIGIAGSHYIPYTNESISDEDFMKLTFGNYKDILEIKNSKSITHLWGVECDFSGYTTTWKYIDHYFSTKNDPIDRNKITKSKLSMLFDNLEDTKFMNYLDNKGITCNLNKPFIYHRILPTELKDWKEGVI